MEVARGVEGGSAVGEALPFAVFVPAEVLRALLAPEGGGARGAFNAAYLELLEAHEQKCDVLYDAVDAWAQHLILDSCVPLGAGADEEDARARAVDEDPNDAALRRSVKRSFIIAMDQLQRAELPKKRRGNLPKSATTLLKKWFDDHYANPYPTDDDKTKLARESGVSTVQISHWFINHRKRVWKPSLPANHPSREATGNTAPAGRSAPPAASVVSVKHV